MNANEVVYTPDEDFDQLIDRDPTTELVGYVDQIIAPAKVGQKAGGKGYDLFKFVLTNGSNGRVLCLIWTAELLKKYQPEITINRILHIEHGYTKAALMNNEKEYTLRVLPFEIIFQKITKVEYKGTHVTRPITPELPLSVVDFSSIKEAIGNLFFFLIFQSNFYSFF
ncbi:uncharacterized protein LOC107981651 [Nasonia vitripennis]|uniref:Uncharacterized protein n=1 Tax=Nasonia vitripennis TaxID=7425 RepID=A0A7M7M7N3_NASVI|nr:uncharacterized protein LOC107981651 [Nasonia vitripennis]XP_032457750.1 uncharacterized protein LOC107981651 [Nasonia vitripennis]